ncbi:MAG: hypothetical protein WDM87_06230 [Terracidiphilus sp.]
MKILAYGGNEYSTRAMIGEWPGISIEQLGDLYGIPSGSPSFGLVFPGGTPALIYRSGSILNTAAATRHCAVA